MYIKYTESVFCMYVNYLAIGLSRIAVDNFKKTQAVVAWVKLTINQASRPDFMNLDNNFSLSCFARMIMLFH
jgi:hypothetical protein